MKLLVVFVSACLVLSHFAAAFSRPVPSMGRMRLAMVGTEIEGPSDVAREVIEKQFKVGKSVQWGVLQAEVEESEVPDDSTRAALREVASRDLVNIDDKERARRTLVGKASGVLAVLSFIGSIKFGLDIIPRTVAIYLPLSFSLGFLESGKQGL
tara:strand:+ start:421 stop:882 length:462 start_codon:yes stop_codon:yes gene_type:complete